MCSCLAGEPVVCFPSVHSISVVTQTTVFIVSVLKWKDPPCQPLSQMSHTGQHRRRWRLAAMFSQDEIRAEKKKWVGRLRVWWMTQLRGRVTEESQETWDTFQGGYRGTMWSHFHVYPPTIMMENVFLKAMLQHILKESLWAHSLLVWEVILPKCISK